MTLTCQSCGNDRSFLVKTLQTHVVHVEEARVEIDDESRPAILEVLCDECEAEVRLDGVEDKLRREMVLTLGAR